MIDGSMAQEALMEMKLKANDDDEVSNIGGIMKCIVFWSTPHLGTKEGVEHNGQFDN